MYSFYRCSRHLSEGLKSHITRIKPDATKAVKEEFCNAIFENPDCLAASLSWEEFEERQLILDQYQEFYDYDHMETLITILRENVAIRIMKPNLLYNQKTNIAESEHHRGEYISYYFVSFFIVQQLI